MTDQERQLLQELAGRVQKAPAPQIDREADDLIRRNIGSRPDALYILTQTVLIQEMALAQAKEQLEDLKRQQPPTSFLGKTPPPAGVGWGGDNRVQQPAPSGYRASSYQSGYAPLPPAQTPPPLPQYAQQPQYAQPQSGFSSFLQNAAQTAAGVVAGEVAFSAISSLFGHHGGYYGGGGGGFLGGGETFISPVSETIINNNYYEGDRDERSYISQRDSDDSARDASSYNSSREASPDVSNDLSNDVSNDVSDDASDDYTDDAADDGSSYDDGSDSSDV